MSSKAEKLREWEVVAMEILLKLTQPPQKKNQKVTNILPVSMVKAAKGITFMVTKRGGLGFSYTKARMFTIRKIGEENGVVQWSGPTFATSKNLGLGITAGFDTVETVLILGNEATVDKFRKGGATFGLELDLVVGSESAITQSETDTRKTVAIPYSIAGGALFDVSLKGGAITINTRANERVYGKHVTPVQILSGEVPPPHEFRKLYKALNMCISAAGADARKVTIINGGTMQPMTDVEIHPETLHPDLHNDLLNPDVYDQPSPSLATPSQPSPSQPSSSKPSSSSQPFESLI